MVDNNVSSVHQFFLCAVFGGECCTAIPVGKMLTSFEMDASLTLF